MSAPSDRKYQESHEWAMEEGDMVVVGISDVAIQHLSDLVFIDLPAAGIEFSKGDAFGEIESVKAVSELLAPVSGVVAEVNEDIADALETLAEDPFGKGWLIKLKPSDASEYASLLDAAAYDEHAANEEH